MSWKDIWAALFGRRTRPAPAGAGAPRPPTSRELVRRGLEDSRRAFEAGDMARADEDAGAALQHLESLASADTPEDQRRADAGAESALLAVRGGVAARSGRAEDARALFERSRERALASGSAAAIGAAALNLIDADTRSGFHEPGDPLLDEAARATRDGPHQDVFGKLLVERGLSATRAGALPAAVALFDRAIALRPAWPFPWYQRGWARFLSGDAGGALEDYRACAERRAPFFTVLREIRCLEDVAAGRIPLDAYRAYCAMREQIRHRAAAVEETAGRIAIRHPDFAPAHLLRAEARLGLGDRGGAREAAREALRHDPDPDTAAAALFLEWNLARADSDAEAVQAAEERLLAAYPEQPAAEIVRRLRAIGRRDVVFRWTWALDGTFRLEEGAPVPPEGEGTRR